MPLIAVLDDYDLRFRSDCTHLERQKILSGSCGIWLLVGNLTENHAPYSDLLTFVVAKKGPFYTLPFGLK